MAKTKKPSGAYRSNAKKQYTPLERYQYHDDRTGYTSKYGIKYGSPAHCYSMGFCDAFSMIDNTSGIDLSFGNRSRFAYSLGIKRGKKAMSELNAKKSTKKGGEQE